MPNVKCLVCTTEFYIKPSHQKRGWGKYCSIACRTKSQFKGKYTNCFICDKKIYRSPRDFKNSDSGNFFCSKSCQTIWRNKILFIGENHSNWKDGKSVYRRILKATGKEQLCTLCKIDDTRVLVVHHRDKDRKNNTIANLIWLCHNCHYLVHHDTSEQKRLDNMVVVVHQ